MRRKTSVICGLLLGLGGAPLALAQGGTTEPGTTGTTAPTGETPSTGTSTTAEPACGPPTTLEFKSGSAVLSPNARTVLDKMVMVAKDKTSPTYRLRGPAITGTSTSKVKKAEQLTQRRDDAIRSYLTQVGVDPASITSMPTREGGLPPLDNPKAMEVSSCGAPIAVAAPPPPLEVPPVAAETPPVPPAPPPAMEPLPPPAPLPVAQEKPAPKGPMSRVGVGAMVGGGVTGFIDKQSRAFTDPGGSWEARASVGTRLPLALEAAYVGSAQNITALGLSDNAKLIGNGAEATARFNFTKRAIQPYIFAGVGWEHYTLDNTGANTSSLRDTDDVLTVPGGVGISFRLASSLLLDLRGTARATFSDDLMNGPYASTGQDARLHNWNAGARLGWEF
jgi:hypothetical protein